MADVTINDHITHVPPFSNFFISWTINKIMVMINGINAAWYDIDSAISPFNNEINARCKPQPGQSIPKVDLIVHLNKCCSSQVIIINIKCLRKNSKAFIKKI